MKIVLIVMVLTSLVTAGDTLTRIPPNMTFGGTITGLSESILFTQPSEKQYYVIGSADTVWIGDSAIVVPRGAEVRVSTRKHE